MDKKRPIGAVVVFASLALGQEMVVRVFDAFVELLTGGGPVNAMSDLLSDGEATAEARAQSVLEGLTNDVRHILWPCLNSRRTGQDRR